MKSENEPNIFVIHDQENLVLGIYQALLKYITLSNDIKEIKIKIPEKFDNLIKKSPYYNTQQNKFFGVPVYWSVASEEVLIESCLPQIFSVIIDE